jgi:ATP-dependent helicase/nuclease subunit B
MDFIVRALSERFLLRIELAYFILIHSFASPQSKDRIMQTILGPFHPYLEDALIDEILRHKENDLLKPILIVVPSDALRRRVKILCARERNLALLNLPILTFYQLSLRLHGESHSVAPQLRGDLFLEEALRQIIRTRQPGAEPFAGIEERVGGCAALWQTLRDLRDGLVDPAAALDALGEGHFSARANQRTSDLLHLLETQLRFCREKAIDDQSDLDKSATERAPASTFLKQFAQIFYYGFYDLTQIQVDLFHAVAKTFPTTLFFPLLPARPSHEAWSFAERFYQRYVQGYDTETPKELVAPAGAALPALFRLFDESSERDYQPLPNNWHCTIHNAFGIYDEVAAAAKEILRLIDDGGLAFHDIGVVARSLEAYGPAVSDIFHEHQIPIAGDIEAPLAEFPLTKAVSLLLNLPTHDFLRAEVIDLLSSPYFQFNSAGNSAISARPELWDLATRELAICKGIAEWRRLRNYVKRDLVLSQHSDDDEPRVIRIGAAQLQSLADIVESLAADLVNLAPHASWRHYAGVWKELLKKYLAIGADNADAPPDTERALHETILEVLDQLAGLDAVHDDVSLNDFSHTFQHWLERSPVAESAPNTAGVALLNASAARGDKFRALFILGLNEGVFPRTIREDAFLRDRDREILERDLGYKVSQKLAGFDEEKLLFTLLVNAARERLYCSFQRSDDGGRVLAPSWYVTELKRILGGADNPHLVSVTIPRSITDKNDGEPFKHENLLLPEELAIRLSLDGKDPSTLLDAFALTPNLYRQGRKAVLALDQSADRLLLYDGVVGALPAHWQHFSERGLSPTALETYARCPFQFFARHILGLERLQRPEDILGPSPAEFGELGHEILNKFFASLIERGYFHDPPSSIDIDSELAAIAQRAFADYEAKNPVGYPLAWENLKDGLVQLLRQVVLRDLGELADSGYTPVSLETDMTDRLPGDWPEPLNGLLIRGRMDRIDRNAKENRLRVIDYKFKLGASQSVQDKNLYRAALRGERLQPPFYFLLGQRWAEKENVKTSEAAIAAQFYFIAPRWADGPWVTTEFGADGLTGKVGAEIKNTIAYLAQGIEQGRFFIQRGEHCGHCEVAEICRKNHPPSLWRAENDPLTEPHRALHAKDPKKL